ncbi:MAG: phosphoenolpyruvate--protein phosphotransferase [Candidatus Omnitrophica bacterium]|nr:phosphoenolpyruvate--protein phosphotransferase [Candidatus Omnitrophota bacterium]
MSETILKGIPAAPGIIVGKAYLVDSEDITVSRRRIKDDDLPDEINRLQDALVKTRGEILKIKEKISKDMGAEHGEIFSAHLLVLEDTMLIEEVIAKMKKEKVGVEYVFLDVLRKYINTFSKMDDEYLKERISDISDVGKRILRNLLGAKQISLADLKEEVVIVAYDLSPSDTAVMHKKNVIGFVTDIGGRTSHTAIMAKSLEIPAVVGLEKITKIVQNGDVVIVDGHRGLIIVNPQKKTLDRYNAEKKKYGQLEKELSSLKNLPCETLDGRRIELSANIELPEEMQSVIKHGANGIGLYRSEYFYMNRPDLPSEDEQYKAYREVAKKLSPKPVIIRTMDLGGDKFLSQLEIPREMNPFMGWRAIRFCLARPDIFKVQLRAILRASVSGNLKIMYPMISGIEELRGANALLDESKNELRKEKTPFNKNIEVGAMIEIPSAALTSDILAKEVKFFSIGTNDLIQYALAVDRVNEKIAYLYEPAHPAVLRLIKNVINNGHKENIWVGMCGEMAGDPALTIILVGLGLDEFSTSPILLPEIKKIIRSVKFSDAKKIAIKALTLNTGREVEDFARQRLKELLPDLVIYNDKY